MQTGLERRAQGASRQRPRRPLRHGASLNNQEVFVIFVSVDAAPDGGLGEDLAQDGVLQHFSVSMAFCVAVALFCWGVACALFVAKAQMVLIRGRVFFFGVDVHVCLFVGGVVLFPG